MLATPCATHETCITKEPAFSKNRDNYLAFDIFATSEPSTKPTPWQFQLAQRVHCTANVIDLDK